MTLAVHEFEKDVLGRRRFLSNVGKGLGLMALSSAAVGSLLSNVAKKGLPKA